MPIPTVAILCGGRGSRIRPFTDIIPKVLIPLQGKPILAHVLELYESKGIENVVLCTGYKGGLVKDYCVEHFSGKLNIEFSDLGVDAGMLERLASLNGKFSGDLLVSYGDTLTDLDLNALFEGHRKNSAVLTIVVAKIKSPFGWVEFDESCRAQYFEEKPIQTYYIGSFVINERLLADLPERLLMLPDGLGLITLFQEMIKDKQLYVHEHKGLQITFNTSAEHKNAEDELIRFFTFREEARNGS